MKSNFQKFSKVGFKLALNSALCALLALSFSACKNNNNLSMPNHSYQQNQSQNTSQIAAQSTARSVSCASAARASAMSSAATSAAVSRAVSTCPFR